MVRGSVLLGLLVFASSVLATEPSLSEHPRLREMLVENNRLRAAVGLTGHRIDERLTCAAQSQANFMARTGRMDHYTNGGPSGRAQRYGFPSGVRENIAYGQPSVSSVFNVWRNSGGHWANMRSGTTLAGFGCQRSANGQWWWAAVYGSE